MSKPHFSLLGTPVRIEPFFWIATVFLAYQLGDARLIIMWTAVVLVSVLVHELGHAMALRLFGQRSAIVLHGFGGLTFSQRRLNRFQSIAVSLAGPLSALALLGVPAYLLRESDHGLALAADYRFSSNVFGFWPVIVFAAYVNLWWSFVNLLPVRPLDGGNVLTEIVGITTARLVSVVVAVAVAVYAYTNSDAFQFVAFFFGFLAFINLREFQRSRQGQGGPSAFDVDGPEVPGGGGNRPGTPTSSPPAPTTRSHPTGRRAGWPVGPPQRPPSAPAGPPNVDGALAPASAESLAWNHLRAGRADAARQALDRATGEVGAFVRATVAAAAGEGPDLLVAAYLAAPAGPSNLAPASVAESTGVLPDLVQRLLDGGSPGVEAVGSIQTHLHYADRHQASAVVGEHLHGRAPSAQVAFDVACAWSRADDAERSITWLHRAVDDGFSAVGLLEGEPDLAAARRHPGFGGVRDRLG